MRYAAQERDWVKRVLARLTPSQRERYEAACKIAPRRTRNGRLYDAAKAEIAERIMLEDVKPTG